MLEWLEVRLDVGDDKRLMCKCRIEALNSDGDALKQECYLVRIAGIAALNRRPTSVRNSRESGAIVPRVSSAIGTKNSWGDRNAWPPVNAETYDIFK